MPTKGRGKGKRKTGNRNKNKKKQTKPDKKPKDATSENDTAPNDTSTLDSKMSNLSVSKDAATPNTEATTEAVEEKEEKSVKEMLLHRPNADKRDPNRTHKFWNKQPVPAMGQKFEDSVNGPIESKTLDEVRKEPLLLPAAFEWVELDLTDEKEVDELYKLLAGHYVEDDDNRFRFNYSKGFLRWALMVPEYKKYWHLGVRVVKSGALCGCITAIPATVSIHSKTVQMVEINFLCVHKKLRSNRLAPVLIKEITRRVNCTERWQAVYTAGVVLPKPVAANRYWHRSLNPEKLVDVGFSSMNRRMTKPRLKKLYKLPAQVVTQGLRPMEDKDCEAVHKMLTAFLKKFKLHVMFSLDEFKHCFLTRKGVVYSFVVESVKGEVTDFISFYELPSTIMNHPKHTGMRAAYSYYNVVSSVKWEQIMYDALILAKQLEFDVFNALDVMENESFLKDLKFKIGDGHLQYYLYNWKCPEMTPPEVALVLL